MRRFLRMLLSRTAFILLLLLLQIVVFLLIIEYFSQFQYVNTLFYVLSFIIVLYIVSSNDDPNYKLSWIIPILIFPLFGGIFYLFYRNRNVSKAVRERLSMIDFERKNYLSGEENSDSRTANYLNTLFWPSYRQTKSEFFPSGEAVFERMKMDLKEAQSFIFMEFFIIKKGALWNEIKDILIERASKGVKIKLIFDDFGSSELPLHTLKTLKKVGIDARAFNRMRMHLNFGMNYRDHRKIVVIDNRIGYTGGINIGDEYINLRKPFGHWLDIGIRIEGAAVKSLTVGFLENYRFQSKKEIAYDPYLAPHQTDDDGIVIPFTDTPLDLHVTSKLTYLQMINSASQFVYIMTPYLIIDSEMANALKLASISGVDVRILIPGIPDKKIVYMVSESNIPDLIGSGVKVYRYNPGFVHAKLLVSDNEKAMIGTVNFDFRSFYLHFENSIYIEDAASIHQMTSFFLTTLSSATSYDEIKKPDIITTLLQKFFKGFSSLL